MADRAQQHGLQLIPHFKTHQHGQVGALLSEIGVKEIAVTSLRMAREHHKNWQAITIAMPVNPREIPELATLSAEVNLTVFLCDAKTAADISRESAADFRYYIEIDAGYGRSGVGIEDEAAIRSIIAATAHHQFRGFYVHSGHTYDTRSTNEIKEIHQSTLRSLRKLRNTFSDFPALEITIGDTPACSTQEDFSGVDAIGPGNFIYYDLVQEGLGSCTPDDIAICLAVPVVQVHAARGEVIVHGGWVQLGKDQLADGTYGRIVRIDDEGKRSGIVPGAAVVKLSQEHGTIRLPAAILEKLQTGDLLGILPVHACAMVHGMRATGEQILIP